MPKRDVGQLQFCRRRGLRPQPVHGRVRGLRGRNDYAGEVAEAAGFGFPEPGRTLPSGTAIFRFDRDHWETDGRAIRNLTPAEAVRHYRNEFQVVEQEIATRG